MIMSLSVESTAKDHTQRSNVGLSSIDLQTTAEPHKIANWEELAQILFSMGPVGVLEGTTIVGRVNGYVQDPVYGKLIRIERVDEKGSPVSEKVQG